MLKLKDSLFLVLPHVISQQNLENKSLSIKVFKNLYNEHRPMLQLFARTEVFLEEEEGHFRTQKNTNKQTLRTFDAGTLWTDTPQYHQEGHNRYQH